MKTFEVSHKLKNNMVSVLKYTNTKLHAGMVFQITGDTKLKGMYVCSDMPREGYLQGLSSFCAS